MENSSKIKVQIFGPFPPIFSTCLPFRLILVCCEVLHCGIRVIVDNNMSDEDDMAHETGKKRKRLSKFDICKREFVKCQRSMKELKEENIRLRNLLAAMTQKLAERDDNVLLCNLQRELEDTKKKLVENRKYVDTLKWSQQQSVDSVNVMK